VAESGLTRPGFLGLQDLGVRSMEKFGRETPWDRATLQNAFRFYYDDLEESYGDWHGFDQNVLFVISRTSTGVRLGY